MSGKWWKVLKVILVLGTILAALKLIFVDYTLDEEYQIVMSYRYLQGDHLFREMWEPHQTSAFLCAGLMWLYTAVTGTNVGVLLFLRFVTVGVQSVLAVGVYRTLKRYLDRDYAFLLALLFFNIVPKNIQIPEFGNMQLWFLTIPVLLLMKYYYDREQSGKDAWFLLIPVGLALSCEILTYPTCIILFPFFWVWTWCKSGERRVRNCALLTGTCVCCAGVWLLSVFRHIGFEEFAQNVGNLLSFDPTHHVSGMTDAKHYNYIENVLLWLGWFVVIAVVAGAIFGIVCMVNKRRGTWIDRHSGLMMFWTFAVVVAELVQAYYWCVRAIGYEYLQIHLFVIWLMTAVLWRYADAGKKSLLWGVVGTLVAYVGVMYISDLSMYYTLPHGALGIVFGVAVIILAMQNVLQDKARPWILLLVVSLCFCSIGGKGFALRGGKAQNTILSVASVMKDGPAVGVFADYMCAHIYNCNYEEYPQYIQDGDNVLIVANMIMSVGTTAYLFEDVNVSHFSVVDPTTYDERLLTYWEQYPEKAPNVIVVDCWFGQLMENPESWIMQYIENDFGYTSAQDGTYVRFYRK